MPQRNDPSRGAGGHHRSRLYLLIILALTARAAAASPTVAPSPASPPPLLAAPEPVSEPAPDPRAVAAGPSRVEPPVRESKPIGPRTATADSGEGAASGGGGGGGGAAWSSWLEGSELLRTLIPLGVVLVVAFAFRGLLLRGARRAPRPSGVVEVLASYPFGRGRRISLLKIGRRVVAVHESDRGVQTLAEATDPDEVAELLASVRGDERDGFAGLLARAAKPAVRRSLRSLPDPFEDAETVDLTRGASRR